LSDSAKRGEEAFNEGGCGGLPCCGVKVSSGPRNLTLGVLPEDLGDAGKSGVA